MNNDKKIEKIVSELQNYDSEREWFEFKENWFDPTKLGEYISALSNSAKLNDKDYGYFVWGIDDKTHEIKGTKFDFNVDVKNEPLKHYLVRQISPEINFKFYELFISGKKMVVLEIPAAKMVPTSFIRERYLRIGSSKVNLNKYPQREAKLFEILREEPRTLTNTESYQQNLTFNQLKLYYEARGVDINNNSFKKNLSLYTKEGKYNMLAQLLSDNSEIPIRVGIFSGTRKSDNMYSVREFGNKCILYSLDDILRYGDVLNIIQSDETNRVVERNETTLFENNAFREAIINAFLHNNWIDGDGPMISVYSDKIEILSRGSLPKGQTLEGFFSGESIPVNRKLSEIFLQLRISEKTGRGVPTIIAKYGKDVFNIKENSIVVNIPFHWINVMGERNVIVPINKILNATQKSILTEIRNNPNITIDEITNKVNRARSTVNEAISVLKEKEYIERIGSNKTGYWRVLEDL